MKYLQRKFLFNLILFVSLPILLVGFVFFVFDPFLIFYKAEKLENIVSYYSGNCRVGTNREHMSLITLKHQLKNHNINSFIFGNSRASAYDPIFWEKNFLSPSDKAFLLNASADSLEGMKRKIKYLDNLGVEIKNVIVTFDIDSLRKKEKDSFLLIDSPLVVSSTKRKLNFFYQHAKTMLNPKFLFPYALFKLTSGKLCNAGFNKFVLNSKEIDFHPATNKRLLYMIEKMIDEEPEKFYGQSSLQNEFKDKTLVKYPSVLSKRQKGLIKEILKIFRKHKTNYKVVIHPGWREKYLATDDLSFIKKHFGEEKVFDLTVNPWSEKRENWYDETHPRPHVTKELMSLLYKVD